MPKELKYTVLVEDLVDDIRSKLPINIKKLENIIDRIHEKYPLIDKTEVAIIVKAIFETMRELLIQKRQININNFFNSMKFYYFTGFRLGHIVPSLKIKINTSPKLRKYVRK